VARLLLKLLD